MVCWPLSRFSGGGWLVLGWFWLVSGGWGLTGWGCSTLVLVFSSRGSGFAAFWVCSWVCSIFLMFSWPLSFCSGIFFVVWVWFWCGVAVVVFFFALEFGFLVVGLLGVVVSGGFGGLDWFRAIFLLPPLILGLHPPKVSLVWFFGLGLGWVWFRANGCRFKGGLVVALVWFFWWG